MLLTLSHSLCDTFLELVELDMILSFAKKIHFSYEIFHQIWCNRSPPNDTWYWRRWNYILSLKGVFYSVNKIMWSDIVWLSPISKTSSIEMQASNSLWVPSKSGIFGVLWISSRLNFCCWFYSRMTVRDFTDLSFVLNWRKTISLCNFERDYVSHRIFYSQITDSK